MRNIPEVDVLIGTLYFLHKDEWEIRKLSIARGKGIQQAQDMQRVKSELSNLGIPEYAIQFRNEGEDIVAAKAGVSWKIECKGLGNASSQTERNNFDRAVASVVSYYTDNKVRLGLAMPEWYFLRYLKNRLPVALRQAINLWIILYVAKDEVYSIEPDKEL